MVVVNQLTLQEHKAKAVPSTDNNDNIFFILNRLS